MEHFYPLKELNRSLKELRKISQRLKEHLAQGNSRKERAGEKGGWNPGSHLTPRIGRVEWAATRVIQARLGNSLCILMRMRDVGIPFSNRLECRSN